MPVVTRTGAEQASESAAEAHGAQGTGAQRTVAARPLDLEEPAAVAERAAVELVNGALAVGGVAHEDKGKALLEVHARDGAEARKGALQLLAAAPVLKVAHEDCAAHHGDALSSAPAQCALSAAPSLR